MNTKPKKIIAAYSKALKNAHKPESRIRLMFVGDSQSGEHRNKREEGTHTCTCIFSNKILNIIKVCLIRSLGVTSHINYMYRRSFK